MARVPRAAPCALLALLVLAALPAPGAQAAPPAAQPWQADVSAAGVEAGPVTSLAFSGAGGQLLVSAADRGLTTSVPDTELVLLQFADGNMTAEDDSGDNVIVEGKCCAAISRNGDFAFAGAGQTGGANLFYYALPDMAAVWTASKTEPITALALSADGKIAVAGSRNASASASGKLYSFRSTGDELSQTFEANMNRCGSAQGSYGSVNALDLSDDGRWVVVGTSLVNASGVQGCVLLFDTADLAPRYALQVGANVSSVDIGPGGQWFAAGTDQGRFFHFQNSLGQVDTPVQDTLNALTPVLAIRASDDGGTVAVADATTVNLFSLRPVLSRDWVAPVAGLRSLDATADGSYIVAGTGQQVLGFHRGSNATLWAIDLPNALVRLAQPLPTDIRLAAASGSAVRGFRLGYGIEVRKVEAEPVALDLGRARSVQLGLANGGSAVDRLELSGSSPGFQVDIDPLNLTLQPGEQRNVTVTLLPQPGALAQLYQVGIDAHSTASGLTTHATINATVGAVPRLALAFDNPLDADRAVFQDDDVDIVVQVQNPGNQRLQLDYAVDQRPNVGAPWEASLSRASGAIDPGGVSTNTLTVHVPSDAANGTESIFSVSARGEGVFANVSARLVVNPIYTGTLDVIPQSKPVAPGKSSQYSIVVANNGTLRELYRLVFCKALPGNIPCLGNATLGLEGWSVALDTGPFSLEHGQSKGFQMAVAAPRGAIAGVDKLVLQVEVISTNIEHHFREFRLVITSVEEPPPPNPKPPSVVPGFEPALALLAAGSAVLAARRRR